MTCLGCNRLKTGENLHILHTGEVVCGFCPDWILECEAIELLKMPLAKRRKLMAAFFDVRSEVAMSSLKKRLISLHSKKRPPEGGQREEKST